MCGICGVYGWVGLKEKEALAHLQIFSQLRGMDSTGVGLVYQSQNRKPEVLKSIGGLESLAGSHWKLFDQRDMTLDEIGLQCVISHHRKATIGKITDENAHPFEFENIIGCHNGTILEHELKKAGLHKENQIDSYVVLEAINETGEIAPIIKDISGAWAFVWWDKQNRDLNFCRNKQRPLWITHSQDEKTLFWASEPWMLHNALKRTGIKYRCNDTDNTLAYLKEDVHYTFGLGEYAKVVIKDKAEAPGYTYSPPPANKSYNQEKTQVTMGYKGPKENAKASEERKGGEVVPLNFSHEDMFHEEYVSGFRGEFIHKRRWLYLTGGGCGLCDTPLLWEHRKQVRWIDEKTPLCPKCADEWADEIEKEEGKRSVH